MSRIERKQAISIGDALKEMFKRSKASATHNTRRIFMAWDEASGAREFTIKKYFRAGVLYITVKSSVLATQLNMQKTWLLEKINAILSDDPLFIKDDANVGFVNELRIK
jgi:predicted nucleic acid-binding Zn ribbon protein